MAQPTPRVQQSAGRILPQWHEHVNLCCIVHLKQLHHSSSQYYTRRPTPRIFPSTQCHSLKLQNTRELTARHMGYFSAIWIDKLITTSMMLLNGCEVDLTKYGEYTTGCRFHLTCTILMMTWCDCVGRHNEVSPRIFTLTWRWLTCSTFDSPPQENRREKVHIRSTLLTRPRRHTSISGRTTAPSARFPRLDACAVHWRKPQSKGNCNTEV